MEKFKIVNSFKPKEIYSHNLKVANSQILFIRSINLLEHLYSLILYLLDLSFIE